MRERRSICSVFSAIFFTAVFVIPIITGAAAEKGAVLTGKAAMGDWTTDAPGVRRKLTVQDLPPPSSNILSIKPAHVVPRPVDARLQAPPGFKIDLYAGGLQNPRFLLPAPNDDIFVVESREN